MKFTCMAAVAIVVLVSCQKNSSEETNASLSQAVKTSNSARGKSFLLKEFVHDDAANPARHYLFFYNRNGNVDSIQVSGDISYTYKAYYQGSRIDSVSLVQQGKLISTNTHFVYKGNRIERFDYYCRACGQPAEFPSVRTFAYDQKGHLITIGEEHLTYDDRNNVVEWTKTFAPNSATYTYDNSLNPLFSINDFFALVVEEPFFWEYALSQHNSVTKTYQGGGEVVYQNQYDEEGRLRSKTFSDVNQNGSNVFTYTYY